jgi:SpoVK/Ycf46/Vps4 family AAA+-type ATPase
MEDEVIYEIDSMSDSGIFHTVSNYVSTHSGAKRLRVAGYEYDSKSDSGSKVSLTFELATDYPYTIDIDGDTVRASVSHVGDVVGTSHNAITMRKMILTAKDKNQIEKLISEAIKESEVDEIEEDRDFINIYVYEEFYWNFTTSQKKRPLDTIYLKAVEKDKIVNDIQQFIDDEHKFRQYAIPYKRSYLLEGPPGTGKSSIIYALASHFDLNIGIFKTTTEKKSFENAYKSLPTNTILLIEDIEHCITDDRKKFGINDLLNVMDGVIVKNRLLTFITTNHVEQLPKVMMRPGRIDMIIHFTYMSKEQIIMIHSTFCKDENSEEFYKQVKHLKKLTPAILQKFLFRRPKRKIEELEEIVNETSENDSYKMNYS